jgi:hypothetical protein
MATATLDQTVEIPEHVAYRKVNDELALVNLQSNMYYGLNPVGARLWELLAEGKNLRDAHDLMAAEYEISAEELERDILRVVERLGAKGLIALR